ncbi:MAG: BMP family ABC transporter substrate-binding protein, partial [Spirochaetales bacterium]|nr:BMP family ABC transporter substrate-binding protein [Spirochaetales bacterium]
ATFREQDGSYLAGLLSGTLTYKYFKIHEYLNNINRIGIILGSNKEDYKRYELGFFAGIKEVNPSCEIITLNINTLNNQEKGEEAVLELKQKGVDIILTVAGDSDVGVFKACEENKILIIGANKDLSISSNNILTSVVKNISIASYLITKDIISGIEVNGVNRIYGLKEGAITLAPFYNYDRYINKYIRELISKFSDKLVKNPEIIPESIDLVVFDPEIIPEIVE